jgi:hypothetical protein
MSNVSPWNYNTTVSTSTPYPFSAATTHDDPRLHEKIFGDFTAFYVTVTICTVLGAFLFLLNIALCCCSRYKKYWQDSNTGKYSVAYIRFAVASAVSISHLRNFLFVFVLCPRILQLVNFVSPSIYGDLTNMLPTYICHITYQSEHIHFYFYSISCLSWNSWLLNVRCRCCLFL